MHLLGTIIKRGISIGDRLRITLANPMELQQRVFNDLLTITQDTAFGKYYQFSKILSSRNPIERFQESVPLFDYNKMHDEWWIRCLNNEEDVCWPGKIEYFALSSGTSGSPSKYIPITPSMQRAMKQGALRMFLGLRRYGLSSDVFHKDMLMIGGCSELKDMGGYKVGDLSGINSNHPPKWLKGYYKPGVDIAKIADWNDRINVIAKNAHKWDVGFLTGIPSWVQLTIERIIEYNKLTSIHELWPGLSVFAHGGVFFEPYRKTFEQLLGPGIAYIDSYLASEGFIAYQNIPNDPAMIMICNNGIFFEFVPFNDSNFDADGNFTSNARAVTIDQVEENVDYAVIMSTCAGAWRYMIGDIVKFTNKEKAKIIISGRNKHFLNICGEHLSVDNMNQAVFTTAKKMGISITEYTVSGIESGNFFAHKWYIGSNQKFDHKVFIHELDKELSRTNDDYATERTSVLMEPQIEVVSPELFYKWLENNSRSTGQSKIPRVMKKDQHISWSKFLNSSGVLTQ